MMLWRKSNRADPIAVGLADRHYNRQKPGTLQFVPPGTCLTLLTNDNSAVWVTSWPKTEYVKHAWAGAWVNSIFRNEGDYIASELIRQAISASRWFYKQIPDLGIVTFIDPTKVRPTMRHSKPIWGYCYLKAGFIQIGTTKGGLLTFQLLPEAMPAPEPPIGAQMSLPILTN